MVSSRRASFSIAAVACIPSQCTPFKLGFSSPFRSSSALQELVVDPTHASSSVMQVTAPTSLKEMDTVLDPHCKLRRSLISNCLAATFGVAASVIRPNSAIAADEKLDAILARIKEAREQLESVPDLIKDEKWDSDAIGSELPDGDEIAALELREEMISHLRYLDMAVYNNVFNPIKSEGQNGATKELVRSYYEDPINEWKASKLAIDELIGLATP
ncbi:hypothetical protein ACHAWF_006114 [Thalassiosira exigua]